MLHKVRLKNFKLHKDTEIEMKPITIFIGPNNSGKSSIFQALMLLKQSRRFENTIPSRAQLIPEGNKNQCLIDVGEYSDIVMDNKEEISIGFSSSINSIDWLFELDSKTINIEYSLFFKKNELKKLKGAIKVDDIDFSLNSNSLDDKKLKFELKKYPGARIIYQPHPVISKPIKDIIEQYQTDGHQQNLEALKDIFMDIENTIPALLDSFHLIYALRGMEEQPFPLGDVALNTIEFIKLHNRSDALASNLAYNREKEKELSNWFSSLMDVECTVRLIPPKKVAINIIGSDKKSVPIVNEGMGLNQLAYLLIPIGLARNGDTILMEEPEAHLYPKLQTELVELLLNINKQNNKQLIIATHSEHILFGFLKALAKDQLDLDDICIYFFENENNKSKIRPLQINRDGSINGGLPGFFEHSIDELLDYLNAIDNGE